MGRTGAAWLERAKQAGKLALSDDYFEIKRFIKIIGSNRRVMDKEVLLDLVPPFDLLSKYRMDRDLRAAGEKREGGKKEKDTLLKKEDVLSCRGSRIRTCDPLLPKQVR